MPQRIHIDLHAMERAMTTGIIRAAAFPQTVLKMVQGGVPPSIAPPGIMQWRFFPDPLSDPMLNSIAEELPLWAITNALKDLDQSFSLLMDGLWDAVHLGRMAAGVIDRRLRHKSISVKTNSAEKHRMVLSAAGKFADQISVDNTYLTTLSDARNCMTHNHGIVDDRRAPEGTFTLRWLSWKATGHGADGSIHRLEDMTPSWVATSETTVVATFDVTERQFNLGDRVAISIHDLMEICFLYQLMMNQAISSVQEFLKECGIPLAGPGEQPIPFLL